MSSPADAVEPATRVLVSPDGTLVARVVAEHIELVSGVTLAVESEVGIDPSADGCDVALAGDPLRLVVVARYDHHVRLHVIDPRGPTAMGELTIKQPVRLIGAAGDHVWLAGPGGSIVVDVVRKELAMWPLALRTPVSAAGAGSGGRFVISTAGVVEEWDPESRAPVRRFRLSKQLPARHLGGGARQVWMVSAAEPDHVEIIPLIKAGQPARIELPEPAARVAADPTHENLIVVGARTRTAYAVDLSGRIPVTPIEGFAVEDAAWLASSGAVVLAVAGLGLELVPLTGRQRPGVGVDRPEPRGASSSDGISSDSSHEPNGNSDDPTSNSNGSITNSNGPITNSNGPITNSNGPASSSTAPIAEAASQGNVAERLSAWRERMRAAAPRDTPAAPAWLGPTEAAITWRDHLATWARSIRSGTRGDPPVLGDNLLDDVATRLGLDRELHLGLWLLYGSHLCGHDGVAAVELAELLRRRWDEALGRGALASTGIARWRGGRLQLTRIVADVLDERPARFGAVVASAAVAPATRTTALIAPDTVGLDDLAAWAGPRLGPLFLANPRGQAQPDRGFLEARARGALPLLRWPRTDLALPAAAVLIVVDEAAARAIPAPVFATWPAR